MSDDRQKRIERRAYEIWDREGRLSGLDAENWRRAEEEIAREEAGAGTPEAKPAKVEAEAKPAPVAKPERATMDKPEAKPERVAKAKPEAKPERVATAKPKPAASDKADEPETPSPSSKAAEKAGPSAAEIQEKGARKRKTAAKKK